MVVDRRCSSWLDINAAGWGWFVDPTPWNDCEFTTPGNQGEQNRMDLLTVLAHEIGHLLGQDHKADGLMAQTLIAGTRLAPSGSGDADTSRFASGYLFSGQGQQPGGRGRPWRWTSRRPRESRRRVRAERALPPGS